MVWRLDRLGRSMPHLVRLVEELLGKDIGFRSPQDGVIDITMAPDELTFNIFSSLAQFERLNARIAPMIETARNLSDRYSIRLLCGSVYMAVALQYSACVISPKAIQINERIDVISSAAYPYKA